jgi:hypothetical protein
LESPHNDWLRVEENGNAGNITQPFVDLSQAQVTIVVNVDPLPNCLALSVLLWVVVVWEAALQLCPNTLFSSFHLNIKLDTWLFTFMYYLNQ